MTPTWFELMDLMVNGPTPSRHGLIRHDPGTDESDGRYGWTSFGGQAPPVPAGGRRADGDRIRVWADGSRLRVEELDGTVNLIADGTTCWQFRRDEPLPIASPGDALRWWGSGTELLERRRLDSFVGDDFTRPTGPVGETTFLGRPAWTVELAPPEHKPHPLQLVVDAETGLVLQQRNDGFGTVREWAALTLGESLDPALFTYDGPSRSEADVQAEREAQHEHDVAARRAWFAENVTAEPLQITVPVTVWYVHEFADDGSFHASLEPHGSLARRPRSDKPWDLRWHTVDRRWTDDRWDWALRFDAREEPTAESVDELVRQLSNGPTE